MRKPSENLTRVRIVLPRRSSQSATAARTSRSRASKTGHWNSSKKPEIVAVNLLDKDPRRVTDRIPAYGLFIDPPLGRAGMTEREVRTSGRATLLAKMPMSRVGRARERGKTLGFMKVIVDAETQRILGAALLSLSGDEVVHSLLDMTYADTPYTVIRRAVHIHPIVTELIPTLLGNLRPLE